MPALANFLKTYMDERRLSLRDMELRSGLSKALLSNLINGKDVEPRLSTLEGISKAVELPMWRVLELAGVNLALPESASYEGERLATLASRSETLQKLLERLEHVDGSMLTTVLNYLEAPAAIKLQDVRVSIIGDQHRALGEQLLTLAPHLLADLPSRDNVYEGRRLDGQATVVTVNRQRLDEMVGWQVDFEWGYAGKGPMDLARAILTHELGPQLVDTYRADFYDVVTSTLPKGHGAAGPIWRLESQQIDVWLILTRLIRLVHKPGFPSAI
jgi:transcriptional regulator with XRE-family HTH domain